jgi:acyl carrier protein
MSAAIGLARERWGRIDGVIHAAGNSGSGRLTALTTPGESRATFRPKVGGVGVLVRLLGETPLDFVALMSSINAVYGAPGACDYAAANAMLDSFAEGAAYPATWRNVVSFNWDAWRDVGMAVDLVVPVSQRELRRAYVETGIPTDAGIDVFVRGLASRRRRLVVDSHGVLAAMAASRLVARSRAAELGPVDGTEALAARGSAGAVDGAEAPTRPVLSSEFAAPGSDLERRLAGIWSELLGVEPIGRHDDFFELGGHSLLATRVLARVQESLGVRLELRDVFDAPTVGRLADRIGTHKTAMATSEEREEIEF